jgi:signal peptidase I
MKGTVRDVLETLVLTLVIFLLVRSVVQNFRVEGRSMEPTLHSGQYLLVNKAIYWNIDVDLLKRLFPFIRWPENPHSRAIYLFQPPQRGDIIVFRYPRDPSRDFIKRVIAVPGEVVEVRQGRVFVNGTPLEEYYINDQPAYQWGPQRLPPDHYFVLGDNRNASSDSHVWGPVPKDYIIGKAWLSYWPPDQFGFLPDRVLATPAGR